MVQKDFAHQQNFAFCLRLIQTFNEPWYNFQFHHLGWTVKSNDFCLLWYTNRVIYMYIGVILTLQMYIVNHIYTIGKKHVQVLAVRGFTSLSFSEWKKTHMVFNISKSKLNQNGRHTWYVCASVERGQIIPCSLQLLGCNRQTFLESMIQNKSMYVTVLIWQKLEQTFFF